MTDIQTVGVIGAGQMGGGIAHVFALAGYGVRLHDVQEAAIGQAIDLIDGNMGRQVNKGRITDEAKSAARARILPAPTAQDLETCDLVIEAATENIELKKTIFRDLCDVLKPDALIATNTSSISITALAAVTDRPDRFIGLHFMNPVPVMKLVEVIRGIATSQDTFEAAQSIVERLEKVMAVSEDFPGFIVNRILMPMINEAI
ncbi:MAG: 3-hydroxyacyl-CoA dehydrogenase NAD-binding domain-containing protein, partial [Pseudomonadota bacterium]